MKKFVLLLIVVITLTSCASDNNSENQSLESFIIVNDEKLSISNGYLISNEGFMNSGRHTIFLVNGEIINNELTGPEDGGIGCDFSNNVTQFIILSFTSPSMLNLEGTYTLSATQEPFTTYSNTIATNVVITNNCISSIGEIADFGKYNGGTLKIDKTANTFIVDFTFDTTSLGLVTGIFEGDLKSLSLNLSN